MTSEKEQQLLDSLKKIVPLDLAWYLAFIETFSEDVDNDGGQWGNFPQTYSHVGLMNTAFRIARKLDVPMFF